MKYLIPVLFLALAGCGSGDDDSRLATLQQAQNLQQQIKKLKADLTTTRSDIATLEAAQQSGSTDVAALRTRLAVDEQTLNRVTLFGHARNASAKLAASPMATTMSVTYGPCADMGQHIGDAPASNNDPLTATVETFKQCAINGFQYEYGAVVETGAIAAPFAVWFTGADCTGDPVMFENDGAYNRQVLQGGVVFSSPLPNDSIIYMVAAGQTGLTITTLSHAQTSGCLNATETHTGYVVTLNDVNVTGVPDAVPSDFVF